MRREGNPIKFRISFGLQYEAWQLLIRLPDWEMYESEAQAKRETEETMVSVLLTADAIFLFYGESVQKILPQQQELYTFSFIRDEAYRRLGPPLSAEDIDRLVEKGELETVLFSDQYILTENDYQEYEGNLCQVFRELKRNWEPKHRMKETKEYPQDSKKAGYLFESIWYQVEEIRCRSGGGYGD